MRRASAAELIGVDLVAVVISRSCSLSDDETEALCEAMARDELARRYRVLRNIVTAGTKSGMVGSVRIGRDEIYIRFNPAEYVVW